MVSKVITLSLRGLEFLWTLLVMALTGNIIAGAFSGNPALINYDMVVAVVGMLSLFYLIAADWSDGLGSPIISIALDGLNTLLFFCAAVAMAAELGAHSCSNKNYTLHNHITNGSHDTEKRCREAQAVTAFLWFGFAAFAASTVFSGLGSRGMANTRGGISRGPSMSMRR